MATVFILVGWGEVDENMKKLLAFALELLTGFIIREPMGCG
jgi:hypothetical protein